MTKRVRLFSDPNGEEIEKKKSSHKGAKIAGGVAGGTVAAGALGYGGLHVARKINDKRIEKNMNKAYADLISPHAENVRKTTSKILDTHIALDELKERKQHPTKFVDKVRKTISPKRWERNLNERISKGEQALSQLENSREASANYINSLNTARQEAIVKAKENSFPNRTINAIDNTAKKAKDKTIEAGRKTAEVGKKAWRRAAVSSKWNARKLRRLIKH